jgi:hypothetical protein
MVASVQHFVRGKRRTREILVAPEYACKKNTTQQGDYWMTPTQRFVAARDFLQQHRLDYDTA